MCVCVCDDLYVIWMFLLSKRVFSVDVFILSKYLIFGYSEINIFQIPTRANLYKTARKASELMLTYLAIVTVSEIPNSAVYYSAWRRRVKGT